MRIRDQASPQEIGPRTGRSMRGRVNPKRQTLLFLIAVAMVASLMTGCAPTQVESGEMKTRKVDALVDMLLGPSDPKRDAAINSVRRTLFDPSDTLPPADILKERARLDLIYLRSVVEGKTQFDLRRPGNYAQGLIHYLDGNMAAAQRSFEVVAATDDRIFVQSSDETRKRSGVHALALTRLKVLEAKIVQLLDAEGRVPASADETARLLIAQTIYEYGLLLAKVGRPAKAIAEFDRLGTFFEGDSSPQLELFFAASLLQKVVNLVKITEFDAAGAVGDALIRRFGANTNEVIRTFVFRVLERRRPTNDKSNSFLVFVEDMNSRFGLNPPLLTRGALLRLLFDRALALEGLGRRDQALQAMEAISTKAASMKAMPDERLHAIFDDNDSKTLQNQNYFIKDYLLRSLMFQASIFTENGQYESSNLIYNQIIFHFKDNSDPDFLDNLSLSSARIGLNFRKLGRFEEAISAYDIFEDKFGEHTRYWRRTAFTLVEVRFSKAQAFEKINKISNAIEIYDSIAKQFLNDPDSQVREIAQRAPAAKLRALSMLPEIK
jgi:tetratricopeptide (TPR) repeat protein